jgi:hypothetical protein
MSSQLVWNLSETEGFWTSQNDNGKGKATCKAKKLTSLKIRKDFSLITKKEMLMHL